MEHLPLLILGLFLSALGIVNILGNVSTIHSYHRRRVREEDIPKYGRAVGTGTLVIGASFAAAFLAELRWAGVTDRIVLPALAVGLGFLLYAQFKYNKGIF